MVLMGRKAVVIYHIRSWSIPTTTGTDAYVGSNFFTSMQRTSILCLRRPVSSRLPLILGSDSGSVHVGFVVDKVALGQAAVRVFWFYAFHIISPVCHTL
jgi:hypothetical protein